MLWVSLAHTYILNSENTDDCKNGMLHCGIAYSFFRCPVRLLGSYNKVRVPLLGEPQYDPYFLPVSMLICLSIHVESTMVRMP
jgi:hypothetical protein